MAISEFEIGRLALAAAEQLLALAGVTTIPVDIGALAAAQGIAKIQAERMDMTESGRLVGLRRFHIYFNRAKSEARQRFSICHELAHTFFVNEDVAHDTGIAVRVKTDTPLSIEMEEELCERVAGALLMPRTRFIDEAKLLSPSLRSVEYLAELFGVGRRAVLKRIEVLSLRWPCAVLRWSPVDTDHTIVGFKLTSQWQVGGNLGMPFPAGSVVSIDGLYRTHHHIGKLAVDEQSGVRLESRSFRRGDKVDVWSLATELRD